MLSDSLQEMLSAITDTLDDLHTASIEFTVRRDRGLPVGLRIEVEVLLAEQKQGNIVRIPKKDVENTKKGFVYHE